MGEIVRYTALHDYAPASEHDISMLAGDILVVENPRNLSYFKGTVEKPESWLEGVNERTQESGTFPGTYVKMLEKKPIPSRRSYERVQPKFRPRSNSQEVAQQAGKFQGFQCVYPHNSRGVVKKTPLSYTWIFVRLY